MSDWGKLLLWMLKTMPWIVCLISAFLAFFPESLTPEIYLPIRQEWGGWFAVLFLVSLGFSVVWLVHRCRIWWHESQRFDRLPDHVKYLLLDLYFGSARAAKVKLNDPAIAALCAQGFLKYCNAGMVTAEGGELMVMVTLTERSLQYFEVHRRAFMERYLGLRNRQNPAGFFGYGWFG